MQQAVVYIQPGNDSNAKCAEQDPSFLTNASKERQGSVDDAEFCRVMPSKAPDTSTGLEMTVFSLSNFRFNNTFPP